MIFDRIATPVVTSVDFLLIQRNYEYHQQKTDLIDFCLHYLSTTEETNLGERKGLPFVPQLVAPLSYNTTSIPFEDPQAFLNTDYDPNSALPTISLNDPAADVLIKGRYSGETKNLRDRFHRSRDLQPGVRKWTYKRLYQSVAGKPL